MKKQRHFILMVLAFSVCPFLFPNYAQSQSQTKISRQELIDDARQLAQIIEDSHPDPYINGGGKIAFHRRLQEILSTIPKKGMSRNRFYKLMLPFVSALGDSHTAIRLPEKGQTQSPGLPVKFRIIEEGLVVDSVPSKDYKNLLGARLLAVEGIPLKELRRRQASLRGIENRYGELAFLCYSSFSNRQGLETLVPEWKKKSKIELTLKTINGEKRRVAFAVSTKPTDNPISLESVIELPSTEKSSVGYGFLGSSRETAILVIEDMMNYREAVESWFASGLDKSEEFAKSAYMRFNEGVPPTDRDALLAGIPSATEVFVSLAEEMKKAGTENLVIDLRRNTGGNSLMRDILIYFLFGKNDLISISDGYSIAKYSELYFQNYKEKTKEGINNNGASIAMTPSDYDFTEERSSVGNLGSPHTLRKKAQHTYASMPSFWKIYKSKKHHKPRHALKKIIVLCSPFTYSSGFNMLTSLFKRGALLVGTPSAQPGNNYGDTLFFSLKHTGITGGVSFKRNITFPEDEEKGRCLRPHFEITYEKFKALDCDANAEVLLSLEIIHNESNAQLH